MDLVEFLRARLEEREFIARANTSRVNPTRGEWTFRADDNGMQVRNDRGHLVVRHTWPDEGEHIALNDPAYVLADIATKREIIRCYEDAVDRRDRLTRAGLDDMATAEAAVVDALEDVLRRQAQPHKAHPDYRSEWAPLWDLPQPHETQPS